MVRTVKHKVIKSGHVYEHFIYSNPVLKGFTVPKRTKKETEENIQTEKRVRNIQRAKMQCQRLINANTDQNYKFVVLTFDKHITDRRTAIKEFEKGIDRLEYSIKQKLKYVAVMELTKKGRIHFHVVLFQQKYIPHNILHESWGKRRCSINRKDIDNVGAYLSKYITKTCELVAEKNEKLYLRSNGLKEPDYLENEKALTAISALPIESLTYESEYDIKDESGNPTGSVVVYRQYNTIRCKKYVKVCESITGCDRKQEFVQSLKDMT